jgi:hypothetical protein
MKMNAPGICLLIHVYYPGSWARIREKCGVLLTMARQVIITCPHPDVIAEIDQPGACILRVPNAGKDIGGKLAAFAYCLQFGPDADYIALIHDKISPQTLHADTWFDTLFGIFAEDRLREALHLFDTRQNVGVIGARQFVKDNEYNRATGQFDTTNNLLLQELIARFGLESPSYDYIAGTIFLARSAPFREFFARHSPLALRRELEGGNVMDFDKGTVTHCWERLFCYIAAARGFKVTGI